MTLEIWLELSGQSKTFQNDFKTNPGKFHFLLGPFVDRPIKIIGPTIKASRQEVLLGIRFDSDRTFKEDITSIYSKANKKFHALTSVFTYMNCQKHCIYMKPFITSYFNYNTAAWMCHSRGLNRVYIGV